MRSPPRACPSEADGTLGDQPEAIAVVAPPHAGQGRRARPRHLPTDLVLRDAAADDPVLGAPADALRHHPQPQRGRRPVADATAARQVFVVVAVVIGFIVDVPDPGVMERPPRTPGSRIATRARTVRWAISGFIISSLALMVLSWGPDEPSTTDPSVSMTMAFAVIALSAVNNGLVMRREREPWWSSMFPCLGWIILGWRLTWAAVELRTAWAGSRARGPVRCSRRGSGAWGT